MLKALTTVSLVLMLGLTACGGGGVSDGGGTAGSTNSAGGTHQDSGGGPEQFEVKGADNSIQEFGEEAPPSEFDEAADSLHGYLDARAVEDWAAACRYLSPGLKAGLAQALGAATEQGEPRCAAMIERLSTAQVGALRESAVAGIGAFRVEGDSGFVLFHGAKGIDYYIPMTGGRGRWLVAAPVPSAFP
jgi:hypothetical protein